MFRRAALALVAGLLLAGCGGASSAENATAAGAVAELTSVDQLRDAFVRDEGLVRVVLLLSPT